MWIPITLAAAFFQVVRTGLQKRLRDDLGDFGATWTRFGYALPFAVVYAGGVFVFVAAPPAPSAAFYFWGLLAAVAQIVATALLLNALSRRRFAIGTLLAKTEALQIAVFGAVFFGETLRPGGWAGVALGGVGLAFIFFAREEGAATTPTWRTILRDRSLAAGLCSGALFALTALFARRAIFAFDDDVSPFAAAALILPALVLTQAILLGCWLWRVDRGVFAKMRALGALPLAVGATSAAGSAGWFYGVRSRSSGARQNARANRIGRSRFCGGGWFSAKNALAARSSASPSRRARFCSLSGLDFFAPATAGRFFALPCLTWAILIGYNSDLAFLRGGEERFCFAGLFFAAAHNKSVFPLLSPNARRKSDSDKCRHSINWRASRAGASGLRPLRPP